MKIADLTADALKVSGLVPIDVAGMLTDRNPQNLYR